MYRDYSLTAIVSCMISLSLALSPIISFGSESSTEIDISITANKDSYLTREPIFVSYQITNVTDSILFSSRMEIREYFVIKDEKGQFYGPSTRGYYMHTDSLLPRKSFSSVLDLTFSYGIATPGVYTCYIEMPTGGFFPYTGAKSNVLDIKVEEPTGDEEKAFSSYSKAEQLSWCRDKDSKKWEQAFYIYLQLVQEYPKSVYAPISLYNALFSIDVIRDKNVVISVFKTLIENYPEFHYVDETFYKLVDYYKTLKDKAGAVEYMKELIKKYPNSKISSHAEYWLSKIEKWEFE